MLNHKTMSLFGLVYYYVLYIHAAEHITLKESETYGLWFVYHIISVDICFST